MENQKKCLSHQAEAEAGTQAGTGRETSGKTSLVLFGNAGNRSFSERLGRCWKGTSHEATKAHRLPSATPQRALRPKQDSPPHPQPGVIAEVVSLPRLDAGSLLLPAGVQMKPRSRHCDMKAKGTGETKLEERIKTGQLAGRHRIPQNAYASQKNGAPQAFLSG